LLNLLNIATESVEDVTENQCSNTLCKSKLTIPVNLDIYADKQLIQLAISHLLRNSCYASRNHNTPIFLSVPDEHNNDQIIIEVKDEGEGFDSATMKEMTEPFFSTREDTAGLGLTIVQQIVDKHDGKMNISGSKNEGCTIQIILPQPKATPELS